MVGATRKDFTGLQVLDQAKRLNHRVVTVVLSRGGSVDLPVEAFESEIDSYLGWPMPPGEPGRRLRNMLNAGIPDQSLKQQPPSGGLAEVTFQKPGQPPSSDLGIQNKEGRCPF
jgi:DNA-binding response OmpR family regulator